jgi:hypothetical protein
MPPAHQWCLCYHALYMLEHVGLGSRVPSRSRSYLTSCHVKAENKRLSSVTNILELPACNFAWPYRQVRVLALQGLHPRQFIQADHTLPLLRQLGSLLIELVDIGHLLIQAFIWLGCQPRPDEMGPNVALFLKDAPHGEEKYARQFVA